MNRRNWIWTALAALPLAVAGAVYANTQAQSAYICPVTGEQLPCEKCCPLNRAGGTRTESNAAAEDYTCPLTGEKLNCPKCCPLNQSK